MLNGAVAFAIELQSAEKFDDLAHEWIVVLVLPILTEIYKMDSYHHPDTNLPNVGHRLVVSVQKFFVSIAAGVAGTQIDDL